MPEALIKGVLEENYALMTLDGIFHKFSSDYFKEFGVQPFHMMSHELATTSSGFVISKESPHLKEAIDPLILRLQDHGFMSKFMAKHVPPKGKHSTVKIN